MTYRNPPDAIAWLESPEGRYQFGMVSGPMFTLLRDHNTVHTFRNGRRCFPCGDDPIVIEPNDDHDK